MIIVEIKGLKERIELLENKIKRMKEERKGSRVAVSREFRIANLV